MLRCACVFRADCICYNWLAAHVLQVRILTAPFTGCDMSDCCIRTYSHVHSSKHPLREQWWCQNVSKGLIEDAFLTQVHCQWITIVTQISPCTPILFQPVGDSCKQPALNRFSVLTLPASLLRLLIGNTDLQTPCKIHLVFTVDPLQLAVCNVRVLIMYSPADLPAICQALRALICCQYSVLLKTFLEALQSLQGPFQNYVCLPPKFADLSSLLAVIAMYRELSIRPCILLKCPQVHASRPSQYTQVLIRIGRAGNMTAHDAEIASTFAASSACPTPAHRFNSHSTNTKAPHSCLLQPSDSPIHCALLAYTHLTCNCW